MVMVIMTMMMIMVATMIPPIPAAMLPFALLHLCGPLPPPGRSSPGRPPVQKSPASGKPLIFTGVNSLQAPIKRNERCS